MTLHKKNVDKWLEAIENLKKNYSGKEHIHLINAIGHDYQKWRLSLKQVDVLYSAMNTVQQEHYEELFKAVVRESSAEEKCWTMNSELANAFKAYKKELVKVHDYSGGEI